MTVRRTPKLTQKARDMFEAEMASDGWQPGGTCPRIAAETGMTLEQVRDALFSESADEWRRQLTRRLSSTARLQRVP